MANSELRSPFVDRMFNLLPQGHEEALKHAFYNVAAICFIAAGGGAAMAVYFILQPFVKPLLWAILVGSILHPIKHRSVILTRDWLKGLDDSNTPLIFGCLSVPVKLIDISAEWIGSSITSNLKFIVSFLIGMPTLYYFHHIFELDNLFDVYQIASNFFSFLMSLETLPLPMTLSLSLGSFGLVVTLAGHLPPMTLKVLAHLTWIFIFFLLVFSLSGSLKVVFILLTLVLVIMAIAIHFGWISDDTEQGNVDEDKVALDVDTPIKDPVHCTPRVEMILKTPSSRFPRLLRETLLSASFTSTFVRQPDGTAPISTGSTNGYIHAALWACLAVQLWRHIWLFHLFPIPLSFFLLKSMGTYVGLWSFLKTRWNVTVNSVSQWTDHYKDQIFPRPMQWIYQAIVFFDRILVSWLTRQVDVVTTAVVMLVVVVVAVLASLFVVVQIYGESVHLVHFGTRVINQTLSNPEAQRWLPQGIDQMVGSVVGNAYAYGQSGIANYVKNAFQEKDPVLAAQLEKTIVEALDRIQGAWLAQDAGTKQTSTKESRTPEELRIAEGNNISQTAKPPLLRRMSQDLLNLTVLMNFGRENVGMIMSIAQSVWTIVKGNFSLVLHSATAMISILMVGGNAILNFLVNSVVFLTALYYLLVASDSQYKPVRLFSLLSPGTGNSLGTAMEEAVSTVCLASLKLTAFYGLWTWLIHTIFQVNFVVIPAAIAALLGAVPFLGTYWAALPAALDLWLAQKRGCEAILLMVFQFLPTMLVDTAIYAEIKGGGHPYLTGLAVAGGIFWLGFEGAIIGPLLLCILLVAVNMYSSFMHDSHAAMEANTRLIHRRLLRTGTVA